MSDEKEAGEPTTETYSPVVAGVSSAWLVGKLAAANVLVPKVVLVLTKVYGCPPMPDSLVMKALPYVIIVGLHLVHDWQKLRQKFGWL